MANAEGGTIYVGVEDNGDITGLSKQQNDSIGVMTLIANSTVPSISTRAEVITEEKKIYSKLKFQKQEQLQQLQAERSYVVD